MGYLTCATGLVSEAKVGQALKRVVCTSVVWEERKNGPSSCCIKV